MRRVRHFYIGLIIVFSIISTIWAASAATIELPEKTKMIESEAFYGDTSLEEVVLFHDTDFF